MSRNSHAAASIVKLRSGALIALPGQLLLRRFHVAVTALSMPYIVTSKLR